VRDCVSPGSRLASVVNRIDAKRPTAHTQLVPKVTMKSLTHSAIKLVASGAAACWLASCAAPEQAVPRMQIPPSANGAQRDEVESLRAEIRQLRAELEALQAEKLSVAARSSGQSNPTTWPGMHSEKSQPAVHAPVAISGAFSSPAPIISLPRATVRGFYAPDSGHWIDGVMDSGSLIKLEDHSLWQVSPLDRIDGSLWLPVSDITVIEGDDPLYPYKLINTDDGEVVNAH